MFYKGRLRVAGDPGEGIPVDLNLDDVYVDLRADGDQLGRWRMDVVEISRLEGNDFGLLLDGEEMIFRAADPLGFAYNAVTTIEEISSRLRKRRRGLFRRKAGEPDILRGAPVEEPASTEPKPTSVSADRIADLGSLLPPSGAVERPPVEDEFFEEFAVEFEEDVAAVSFSGEDVVVADSVPVDSKVAQPPAFERPIESFDDHRSEVNEIRSDDSTPELTPDDPSMESFDAMLTDPAPTEVETDERSDAAEPFDPGAIDEIAVEQTAGPMVEFLSDEPVRDEDFPENGTDLADQLDESADGSAAAEDGPQEGVVEAYEPEPIESEPASPDGEPLEAEPESQQQDEFEPETLEAEPLESEALETGDGIEPEAPELEPLELEPLEAEPEEMQDAESDATPSAFEGLFSASEQVEEVAPSPAPTPGPEEPTDASSDSTGHRGKRRGFFGRGKGEQEHEHDYRESRTVGGITRRVCAVCDHVSFAGEDVYEDWK